MRSNSKRIEDLIIALKPTTSKRKGLSVRIEKSPVLGTLNEAINNNALMSPSIRTLPLPSCRAETLHTSVHIVESSRGEYEKE
jgi:hypothetical protein